MVSSTLHRTVFRMPQIVRAFMCLCAVVALLALVPQQPRDLWAAEPLPHIGDEIAVALQDLGSGSYRPASDPSLKRRSEVLVEPQPPAPQAPSVVVPRAPETDSNAVRERRSLARSIVTLKNEYERLARYHEQLQRKFEKLSLSNEQLLKRHEQLQQSVGDLVRYNKELQGNIAELKKTREQLRGSYDRLNGVYSELRRRGSDSGAFAVPPPSMRTFGESVPARAATNGEGYNNEVMRTGPAKFPPDFTN